MLKEPRASQPIARSRKSRKRIKLYILFLEYRIPRLNYTHSTLATASPRPGRTTRSPPRPGVVLHRILIPPTHPVAVPRQINNQSGGARVQDNNAALLNSRNPVKSKTQKHLDVYHHITRENQMEFKTINVYRLPTDQMRADLMTKNLPKPTFWRHVINSYNYEPKDYVLNGIHFQI